MFKSANSWRPEDASKPSWAKHTFLGPGQNTKICYNADPPGLQKTLNVLKF